MRKIIPAVLFLASCANHTAETKAIQPDSISQQEVHQASLSQKVNSDTIPGWLKEMYNKSFTQYTEEVRHEAEAFTVINDSVSYCIVTVYTSTCARKMIVTLVHRKQKQEAEIFEGCDSDLSYGSYSWTEFSMQDKQHFIITAYTESVADSLLNDQGWIKDAANKDRLELDTKTDSVKRRLSVTGSGEIVTKGYVQD
jgi:hypothetical protein